MQNHPEKSRNNRIIKLVIVTALLLIAGGLYYLAIRKLGIGIRCPFERLTGYLCPGCGITGMCYSIIQGRFSDAWRCNQLTFALMPFYIGLAGYLAYRYIEHDDQKLPTWVSIALWILVAAYIVFGVWRNI